MGICAGAPYYFNPFASKLNDAVRYNGKKRATLFAIVLQNELNSDVALFTTHELNLSCSKSAFCVLQKVVADTPRAALVPPQSKLVLQQVTWHLCVAWLCCPLGNKGSALMQLSCLVSLQSFFNYIHQQVKQMAQKDERVKIMNEILSGIKVIIRGTISPSLLFKILSQFNAFTKNTYNIGI